MPLGGNQTMVSGGWNDGGPTGPSSVDGTDYADFLQYVNSFNWSDVSEVEAIDDPFTVFFGGLDGASAPGLDPATFWLNFSGSTMSTDLNSSVVDTAITSTGGGGIWEAGKLRIPLYRYFTFNDTQIDLLTSGAGRLYCRRVPYIKHRAATQAAKRRPLIGFLSCRRRQPQTCARVSFLYIKAT